MCCCGAPPDVDSVGPPEVHGDMGRRDATGGEVEPSDPLPSVEKPDVNAGRPIHCAIGGLLHNAFLVPSMAGPDGSQMGSGPNYPVHDPGSSISSFSVGQG